MRLSLAMRLAWVCLAQAQQAPSNRQSIPTFGTTVVVSSGLRGDIYLIPADTAWLPDFKHLKPVGSIFTNSLNVPPEDFRQGFPGVTSRFEWFAIDYTGKFWIDKPGRYRFGLTSDDGAKLYIDGRLLIDNDGIHAPSGCSGAAEVARGIHTLRLSYFQGPRFEVALILAIAKAGEAWKIFDTRNFTPPSDSAIWASGGTEATAKPLGKVHRGNCWGR